MTNTATTTATTSASSRVRYGYAVIDLELAVGEHVDLVEGNF